MAVTDKDNGYRQMMASLASAKAIKITVGIHAEEGAASHADGGGMSVAEIAEANEFGLGVPARPFVSGWADQARPAAMAKIKKALEDSLKRKTSPAMALDALAQAFAGEVQEKISAGVPPPNSPATIARKGSSTPLIDTGQLRASIRGKAGKK